MYLLLLIGGVHCCAIFFDTFSPTEGLLVRSAELGMTGAILAVWGMGLQAPNVGSKQKGTKGSLKLSVMGRFLDGLFSVPLGWA